MLILMQVCEFCGAAAVVKRTKVPLDDPEIVPAIICLKCNKMNEYPEEIIKLALLTVMTTRVVPDKGKELKYKAKIFKDRAEYNTFVLKGDIEPGAEKGVDWDKVFKVAESKEPKKKDK